MSAGPGWAMSTVEAVRRRDHVVVHEPDPVEAPARTPPARRGGSRRHRRCSPRCGATCSGRSVRALEHVAVWSVLALSTTKTASGRRLERGEAVEAAGQQVGAVEGDDHDRDGLDGCSLRPLLDHRVGHARNLSWPVKSPRTAARKASRAEPEPAPVALGERVEPDRLDQERQDAEQADVLAQVGDVVADHAVVLEVRRRVVVRRAAEHHRRAEVVGRRVEEVAVHDRGDPGTGAAGPPEVLDVVAPDEELLAGQPDPLDEVPGESTPLNGMTTSSSTPSTAARSTSARSCTTRAVPGSRIGKHSRSRVALGDDGGAEEVVALGVRQQGLEAVRRGLAVVVHEPEQVGAVLHGTRQPRLEAACAAGVRSSRTTVEGDAELVGEPLQHRGGVVGGGVVDHDDVVRAASSGRRPPGGSGPAAPDRFQVTTTATVRGTQRP